MRKQQLYINHGDYVSKEALLAYLKNKLNETERERIDRLIAKDPFLQDAVEGLEDMPSDRVEKALDEIYRDIDILTGAKKPFTISRSAKMYALAATMLLFLGFTIVIMSRLSQQQNQNSLALEKNTQSGTVKNSDSIVPEGMGSGAVSADTVGSFANKEQAQNTIVADHEITAGKTITVERADGDISVESGPDMAEAAIDEISDDNAIGFSVTSLGEVESGNKSVQPVVEDAEKLDAPFTTSNVATSNETYYELDKKESKDESRKREKGKLHDENEEVAAGAPAFDRSIELASADDTDSTMNTLTPDVMPQFPGGEDSLLHFIESNLMYPQTEMKFEGSVYIEFMINADGSISNAKVVKGLSPSYDIEALRVVNMMPAWVPGKQNGVPVSTKYTLVVKFRE